MEIEEYFSYIRKEVDNAYKIANEARAKGIDPKPFV
jgi:hypothetical protein